ncbi:MAG: helix-turn-helix domain-containing protein [Candidatus Saccharimonadales bacterium]
MRFFTCATTYDTSRINFMGQIAKPFKALGQHIQGIRQQARRSVADVCGAVEIGEKQLKKIEAGYTRPDEDVMLLLISYFNLPDQEALHIWDLGNYDTDLAEHLQLENETPPSPGSEYAMRPMIMMMAMDVRTMYSDGLDIMRTDDGLTLSFTQATKDGQALPVARVGMSYSQAEKVLKTLEIALLKKKYVGKSKLLPTRQNTKRPR